MAGLRSLVLVPLIALAVAAASSYVFTAKSDSYHVMTAADCAKQNEPERDYCYFHAANQSRNITLCDRIEAWNNYRSYCYGLFAAREGLQICNRLQDGTQRLLCYGVVGNITRNSSLMGTSLCDEENDSAVRQRCYCG